MLKGSLRVNDFDFLHETCLVLDFQSELQVNDFLRIFSFLNRPRMLDLFQEVTTSVSLCMAACFFVANFVESQLTMDFFQDTLRAMQKRLNCLKIA